MKKPTKGQIIVMALVWATIISVILYALGVRQSWIYVAIYSSFTFISIFGKMDEYM